MRLSMAGFLLMLVGFPASLNAADPELPPPALGTIDFEKDVRPIFAEHCLRCHGSRRSEGGYRLDLKQTALEKRDSDETPILPGRSEASLLIRMIAGLEESRQMPAEGEQLGREQIGILRAWIDQGASWPDDKVEASDPRDWWSLRELKLPAIPDAGAGARHPIDAFIDDRLRVKGWQRAVDADRRTLARRLWFDLVGLPPERDDLERLLNDLHPAAIENQVDRLLASPRYGERWARHWMDAAHFAETHGHDQDRIRENAWPYRDYLIGSLNEDVAYDRFIKEQVAGDALYPDDPDGTVALGFLAAGPWDESSLRDIREDTSDRQAARYIDRDDMLATVINNVSSLTVQCARCHDHKFDPISQRDYYSLQAIFSGVERANRLFDADPEVHQRRQSLLRRRLEINGENARETLLASSVQAEVEAWEHQINQTIVHWNPLTDASYQSTGGAELIPQTDGSILASGTRPEVDTITIAGYLPVAATAIRLELLPDASLPAGGPGRADNGNLHLSELTISVNGQQVPIHRAIADFNQEAWEIDKAIDGREETAWGIHPKQGLPHQAIFEFARPLPSHQMLTMVLKQLHGRQHIIGRFRATVTESTQPTINSIPETIRRILQINADQRSIEDRVELARYQQQEVIQRSLAALPPPSFIYSAASDFEPDGSLKPPPGPRPIHLLRRGDVRQPREEISPGAIRVLGIPADCTEGEKEESRRRAWLAGWLTDSENVLTWRSIVNRVWHHHFGKGLCATPSDLGKMGATPTHPELIDWLAVTFRDEGRSLKDLHRAMVTSSTYLQTSRLPLLAERAKRAEDADNQLLWRMNRIRLDAEVLRDAALACADQLDLRMGGPSDRQFDLKPGIHVTPIVNYTAFDPATPLGRRRSVYRFLFRTLPDPFMEALDCPAGDQMTPVRANSVTVQQVFALWNNVFMIRQATEFARRLDGVPSVDEQVSLAFEIAFGRLPTSEERSKMSDYVGKHGWANGCRVLFNANEFVFVE